MFPSLAPGSQTSTFQLWLVVLVVLCIPLRACALTNVTVDRNSPAVSYSPMDPGMWREAWPGVRISGDGRSKAALQFTGSAIYYQGWLWSQPTTFLAQVDDQVPITLDLTDRGTGQGEVDATPVPTTAITILIAQNLTETAHQVVLSKMDGQREVIVGTFIYSTENPPATSSSSSSSHAATGTPSKNTASSGTPSLKILLPSVFGSVAFTILFQAIIG